MRTIGLIGGMSWESTVSYYQIINEEIKQALGGFHSAKCIVYSVDFAEIEERQRQGAWEECALMLTKAALALQDAGAQVLLICTNTMHKVADEVQKNIAIPLLHIAEATARVLREQGVQTVALLGTRYTMEQTFYTDKLADMGIRVLLPAPDERELINQTIFNELCMGEQKPASRRAFLDIMQRLSEEGAQGVILGCTEIGMLVRQEDTDILVFDTTLLHARAAAAFALEGEHQGEKESK